MFFKASNIELKTPSEIEKMRVAGRVTAEVFEQLCRVIKPGISTKAIDKFVDGYIRSQDMVPAFFGIKGIEYPFPSSACISINEEVVHGIPDEYRVIKEGDIVSVDVGVLYNGYYGDSARTYRVGEVSEIAEKLLKVTELSLYEGIRFALVGNRLGDISSAVQRTAESNGFSVVRDFVGHGIGRQLWEDPPVPNYGKSGTGVKLKAGMVLAIEPMVNVGGYEVRTLNDGWTVVTRDGSLSAHFEHTVVITENGNEILTKV